MYPTSFNFNEGVLDNNTPEFSHQQPPTVQLIPHPLPENFSSSAEPEEKATNNIAKAWLIAGGAIALSFVGMLGIGLHSIYSNAPEPETTIEAYSQAEIETAYASEEFLEEIYRFEIPANGIFEEQPGPGLLQKLVANIATNKNAAIKQQRQDRNHVAFRQNPTILWFRALVNGVQKVVLAAVGTEAVLEYKDSSGKLIREKINPAMFAAIGMLDIAATEQGQNGNTLYDYSLDEIATDVLDRVPRIREARLSELQEKNLVEPARELTQIKIFQGDRVELEKLTSPQQNNE